MRLRRSSGEKEKGEEDEERRSRALCWASAASWEVHVCRGTGELLETGDKGEIWWVLWSVLSSFSAH